MHNGQPVATRGYVTELVTDAAIEFIEADELVEVTPAVIRLRKILLAEHERRKVARAKAGAT